MERSTRETVPTLGAIRRVTARNLRRIWVTLAGFGLVAVGIVLLVLPGPGVAMILSGLALLATEYAWARRALDAARRRASAATDRALRRRGRGAGEGR